MIDAVSVTQEVLPMKRFSKNIDHLGLVAGMCDELGLAEMIGAL